MARLIWTEPALNDLETIAEYIALDKPDAAKKYVQRVFERTTCWKENRKQVQA